MDTLRRVRPALLLCSCLLAGCSLDSPFTAWRGIPEQYEPAVVADEGYHGGSGAKKTASDLETDPFDEVEAEEEPTSVE